MQTLFSEMKKSLEGRWKKDWSSQLILSPVARAFRRSLEAATRLQGKAKDVRATGKYSEQGLSEELRKIAAEDAVPILKQASADLDVFEAQLTRQKNALTIPLPDPNNAAQAIVRSEMRAWLRSLPQTQAVQVLLREDADDRMVQAAFEAPAVMSGLTEHMRKQVLEETTKRKFGPELAKMEEMEEALAQGRAALQISLYQMRQEIGFRADDDAGFNKWIKNVTGALEDVQPAQAAETELGNVLDQIDEIFARAFPALYADHPANQPL